MNITIAQRWKRSGKLGLAAMIVLALVATITVVARAYGTSQASEQGYSAQIRRTEYGIPHITAKDYGALDTGTGTRSPRTTCASWPHGW